MNWLCFGEIWLGAPGRGTWSHFTPHRQAGPISGQKMLTAIFKWLLSDVSDKKPCRLSDTECLRWKFLHVDIWGLSVADKMSDRYVRHVWNGSYSRYLAGSSLWWIFVFCGFGGNLVSLNEPNKLFFSTIQHSPSYVEIWMETWSNKNFSENFLHTPTFSYEVKLNYQGGFCGHCPSVCHISYDL